MNAHRVAVAVLGLTLTACTPSEPAPAPTAPQATAPTGSQSVAGAAAFMLVGHEPLLSRGMNAGLAVRGGYAYVGNRTDSSGKRLHAGALVVDVGDPSRPQVVGEFGVAPPGLSSRELRIWPAQDLLVVMYLPCSGSLHRCAATARPSIRFYDIRGPHARAPALVADFATPFTPHEMFLWIDPRRGGRALLYVSTDTPGANQTGLFVLDISRARDGDVEVLTTWSGNRALGDRLHSVGVSREGERAYLAHLHGGLAVLDTSGLARAADDAAPRLLTDPARAVRWSPGPHSAIEVPGTTLVMTTDEAYGGEASCPWGWARLVDVADPMRPRLAGELRIEHNDPRACPAAPASGAYSYSSHNPTLAGDVVLVSWHGAGLVAAPVRGGMFGTPATFLPAPLRRVTTEDPRLTSGPVHVAVWSTPIVSDGLIYVVDVRNGLYVLRLTGAGTEGLAAIGFAEGNSNVTA